MAINVILFNDRASFGTYEVGDYDDNGNQIQVFNTKFTVWCGKQNQSLNQQYALLGSNITDTLLIAIRHGQSIDRGMVVQLNGKLYNIINISVDNRIGLDVYDLITLREYVKL